MWSSMAAAPTRLVAARRLGDRPWRGHQGLKRSTLTRCDGGAAAPCLGRLQSPRCPAAGTNARGAGGLDPRPGALTVPLDRGGDRAVSRALRDDVGWIGSIARKGVPAPLPAGARWVVERPQSWMNDEGKLRRCTETARCVVDLYLFLTATIVVTRCLIPRARPRYRWPNRPTTRRLN